jgi:hypothetical protein
VVAAQLDGAGGHVRLALTIGVGVTAGAWAVMLIGWPWAQLDPRAVCPGGHVPEDISDVGGWLPARLRATLGPRAVAELARALPALVAERARPGWEPQAFALSRGVAVAIPVGLP